MPARLGYRPSLDGIRGLAIASVVGFHAFGRPAGGYLGVDLFFVLSGFLITTLLLEERDERGRASLRAFYVRRALRLLPGLVAMVGTVVTVMVVHAVATGDTHDLGRTLAYAAAGIGYVTNIVLAASGNGVPGLAHLWSLATEEQFYLLWPPTLLLLLGGRRRWALGLLGLALGIELLRQVTLLASGAPGYRLDFAPDTRGSSIVIGCLVALVWRGRRRAPGLAVPGLILVAVPLLLDVGKHLYQGGLVLFGAGAGMLILRALEPGTFECDALSFPPLVALGRVSYSLYLWHVPVLAALGVLAGGLPAQGGWPRQVAGVAVSLGAAVLSYRFVEQPFLRRKRQLERAELTAPRELRLQPG
jgi:peptidoglycan/LPS O-acetylase OafA/YrhL